MHRGGNGNLTSLDDLAAALSDAPESVQSGKERLVREAKVVESQWKLLEKAMVELKRS